MKHPANKLERRRIGLRRAARRGTSRLASSLGSLPVPLRPFVPTSSAKTLMPGQVRQGHDLIPDEGPDTVELSRVRQKIPYKGRKWERMKDQARRLRVQRSFAKFEGEIENDRRLKANKNAVDAILAYQPIKFLPGKTLFECLVYKFQQEGNAEAAQALKFGRRLLFDEGSGKWVDSAKFKARRMEEEQRRGELWMAKRHADFE